MVNRNFPVPFLEERIELGKNTLYSWKKKIPTGANLIKVAEYFDVSTDYLLGLTDIKRYYETSEKDNSVQNIAAHHDGEEWSEEELEEIKQFKRFVTMRREARKHKGE
ncbi:XRE family transcriptional regulator [Lysinibacillus xylanilyticus]|uniref:XRE family transcriptional regulator n=1 Tax=Lysinibacillus xylanilyticus TaxID=582475 RepID=UPI0038083F80